MNTLIPIRANTLAPANLLSSPPTLAARFLEPAGMRWGRFPASGGASLRWAHLAGAPGTGPAVNCVLVGGFSEFIEKYFETMRDLAQRGVSVWCLDWRGQGGSERDTALPSRPLARAFDTDAKDLAAFTEEMLPRDGRRLLTAHSMGGAIALVALHKNPGLVDAAVLSAPMLKIEAGIPRTAARVFAWLATTLGFAKAFIPGTGPWRFNERLTPETSPTSHDPERCLIQRTWFEAQPRLRVDGPTFGWLNAAFKVTDRFGSKGYLEHITTPILMGSAGRERFVSPRKHRRAAKRLPHCRLIEFPTAKHELFLEADNYRSVWFAEIDAFLAAHFNIEAS